MAGVTQIVPAACIPFDAFEVNPFVVLCTTSMGGHIGWHEAHGTQWITKQV